MPAVSTAPAASPVVQDAHDEALSVRDLLRRVLSESPRVRVQQAGVPIAKADLLSAELLPNPNLAYDGLAGLRDPSYVNSTQHQLTLSQPLLLWGQREQRRRAAETGVTAAQAAVAVDRATFARDLRLGFVELLGAQAKLLVWTDASDDLQRAQQIVRARVQSGVMSEYDALRLDVELRGLEAEVSAARADVSDQHGQLTELALMPQLAFWAKGDLLGDDSLQAALPAARTAPLLAWAKAEEVAAQSEIELARRNAKPVPVAGVGAMFTTNGVALAASLGLAMDLPVFDRGQGAIARAEATTIERHRQREATQLGGTASILRSDKLLADRARNARHFDLELAHQLEELRRMGDAAYKSGAGGILSLLDTERAITDARLKQVELHRLVAEARVEALAARGWADSDLP